MTQGSVHNWGSCGPELSCATFGGTSPGARKENMYIFVLGIFDFTQHEISFQCETRFHLK